MGLESNLNNNFINIKQKQKLKFISMKWNRELITHNENRKWNDDH